MKTTKKNSINLINIGICYLIIELCSDDAAFGYFKKINENHPAYCLPKL